MTVIMKGITCCADCAYYSMKKHRCTRATDVGKPTDHFYADCPLPTVTNAQGWISVKDRLPEFGEACFAACRSLMDNREPWVIEVNYGLVTHYKPWGVPLISWGEAEVYAWQPKVYPEPPKEGDGE